MKRHKLVYKVRLNLLYIDIESIKNVLMNRPAMYGLLPLPQYELINVRLP